jgi:hypothetical protein
MHTSQGPGYYTAGGRAGGGYVAVASDPEGKNPVGVAIPRGAIEDEDGDLLAVFSLVIGPEQVPGTWACRRRRFIRIHVPAVTPATPPESGRNTGPLSSRVPGHLRPTCRSGDIGRN